MKSKKSTHHRTTEIIIRKDTQHFRSCAYVCQVARRIKNATNYLIRHEKKVNGKPISHSDADKRLKKDNAELYQKLSSAFSQRMTQIVGEEWNSFYKSLDEYNKTPPKYEKRPQPPKYAHKATTAYVGRNGFRVEGGVIHFLKRQLPPLKTHYTFSQNFNAKADETVLSEIRIVPKGNYYAIELIINTSKLASHGQVCLLLDKSRHAGIDLGIDNLMAIATNQPDIHPALVKGKGLKSINAWYNKRVAQLRSQGKYAHIQAMTNRRNRRIKDQLHKASKYIADYCLTNNIGHVVIGHNKGWKKETNIGKVNNQKFVGIPHSILIKQLQYKLTSIGVTVIVREESYTSKASAIDNDFIPNYGDKTIPMFSGRRIKRGLYLTRDGSLINADINACLNIMRKGSGELLACKGRVNHPITFYPVKRAVVVRREKLLSLAA